MLKYKAHCFRWCDSSEWSLSVKMEEEVPAMVVRGYEVKEVTAVTGEARRPSPKSPWSEVERRFSYVGLRVELVPVVLNGLFLVTIRNYRCC